MAAETPVLYNVETWVEENQKYFLPPVCNKMMHNTQLKVRSKLYIPNTIKNYAYALAQEISFVYYTIKVLFTDCCT